MNSEKQITVEATVNASVENAWNLWTEPDHIIKWCQASPEWHVPKAENDLRIGGRFTTTMAAKDGSMSFDFGGMYTSLVKNNFIAYTIDDGRKVEVTFSPTGDSTFISETFEMEDANPSEMQKGGWQAILESFKSYAESHR